MKCAPEDVRKEMNMQVNIYALSRSKDFDPSKSFKVDVDDGRFLAEAKVRDGKILHPSLDKFEGRLEGGAGEYDRFIRHQCSPGDQNQDESAVVNFSFLCS